MSGESIDGSMTVTCGAGTGNAPRSTERRVASHSTGSLSSLTVLAVTEPKLPVADGDDAFLSPQTLSKRIPLSAATLYTYMSTGRLVEGTHYIPADHAPRSRATSSTTTSGSPTHHAPSCSRAAPRLTSLSSSTWRCGRSSAARSDPERISRSLAPLDLPVAVATHARRTLSRARRSCFRMRLRPRRVTGVGMDVRPVLPRVSVNMNTSAGGVRCPT